MPALSVVIPTLNRQQIMRETVGWYLANRVFEDFELVVVDQSDVSDEELVALAGRDERLRYFKVNFRGMTPGRNFGVSQARTDLVVFSEDDVVPVDRYLQVYYDHFANTNSNGATGPVLAPGQRLRSFDELTELEKSRLEPDRYMACADADFAYSAVFGFGGNAAYRRSAILELGGFDEEYSGSAWGEDYEFGYRFRQRFGTIDYLPEASVVHLAHSSGGSRTLRDGKYVRNFCRNSIYTHCRTKSGFRMTTAECWKLARRFVLNKGGLGRPRPHWLGLVALGCWDGYAASCLPRKLPLSAESYGPVHGMRSN